MKTVKISALSACLALAMASPVQALNKDQSTFQKMKETVALNKKEQAAKKSRQVSGQVIKSKKVDLPGKQAQNLVVMLKTTKGNDRLIVDLGNAKNIEIPQNAKIKVEGRLVQVGDKNLLVARHVKIGDQLIKIDRSVERQNFELRKSPDTSS